MCRPDYTAVVPSLPEVEALESPDVVFVETFFGDGTLAFYMTGVDMVTRTAEAYARARGGEWTLGYCQVQDVPIPREEQKDPWHQEATTVALPMIRTETLSLQPSPPHP